MTQRLNRYTPPLVRYKKNMARILWNHRSNYFSDSGKQDAKDIFRKHFGKEWHDIIADEYPNHVLECITDPSESGIPNSKYPAWRKATKDMEDEEEKREIFLYWENIKGFLEVYYDWPNGSPDKRLRGPS